MKRIVAILVLMLGLTINNEVNAQAFGGKGASHLLLGVGYNHHTTYFGNGSPTRIGGTISSSYAAFNVQYEIGVHDYVGIGIASGLEFTSNLGRYHYNNGWGWGNNNVYGGFAIPLVFFGNFHFLQLINDKTNNNFAEKLDVYAGLALGTGLSFATVRNSYNNVYDPAFGMQLIYGANVGIRYMFKPSFGIYAELGWGKTIAQLGVAFK